MVALIEVAERIAAQRLAAKQAGVKDVRANHDVCNKWIRMTWRATAGCVRAPNPGTGRKGVQIPATNPILKVRPQREQVCPPPRPPLANHGEIS
jgi:hypothetical protein